MFSLNCNLLFRTTLTTLALLAILVSPAGAATLNVAGGQLLGASDVLVGGNLYNVAFAQGTCIALFDDCDDSSDFTFTTQAAANLASQALLDQVFIDGGLGLFDTDPELTTGCTSVVQCFANIVYGLDGANLMTSLAVNKVPGLGDSVAAGSGLTMSTNLSGSSTNVYAVWSPVPEPGTGLLLAGGLIAMGIARRRQ